MRCPIGILVSILSPLVFCWLLKIAGPGSRGVSVSETENVEVINGALFMTRTRPSESAGCVPGTVVFPCSSHR